MRAKSPDLIITDLLMPVLGGEELIRELKKHDTWRGIPVIVTSGVPINEAMGSLVDAFIMKPVDIAKLKALIQALLARSKYQ